MGIHYLEGGILMLIRRAEVKENKILTELAVMSEAYWGYDKRFWTHIVRYIVLQRITSEIIQPS